MVNIQSNPLYYAAIGGLVIGIATSINYAFRGSVTGISGIIFQTVSQNKTQMPKNITIIGGMILIAGIFFDIFGYDRINNFQPFGSKDKKDKISVSTNYIGYGVAGLLVGFGTKLSNGCTSGHGLCGLARFSIRSIVAVCTFLFTGMIIATFGYHFGGLGLLSDQRLNPILNCNHLISANICIAIGIILPLLGLYLRFQYLKSTQNKIEIQQICQPQFLKQKQQNFITNSKEYIIKDQLIIFFVGILFGTGLLLAGMVRIDNVIMFLSLGKDWNPSLMFVLGCGVIVNLIVFNYFIRIRKSPLFGQKLFNPQMLLIDWKLILGAMCFGFGWGIGGLCPGPTIMQFAIFSVPIHCIWLPCMLIGQVIACQIQKIEIPQKQSTMSSKQKSVEQMNSNSKIVFDVSKSDLKLKKQSSNTTHTSNQSLHIQIKNSFNSQIKINPEAEVEYIKLKTKNQKIQNKQK